MLSALCLLLPSLLPLQDSGAAALELGRAALADGRTADANRHLRHAFALNPNADTAALLGTSCGNDEDARALWAHAWFRAAADADGRARAPRDTFAKNDPHPERIAVLRAAAVQELVRFAESRDKKGSKDAAELLVARWARRTALELARANPALENGIAKGLAAEIRFPERLQGAVIDSLKPVMSSALAAGRTHESMRAARTLRGLAVQAAFADLQGKRPRGMERVRDQANKALARARDQVARKVGEPWTIEELEWLTLEEGEAFTREHLDFGLPGVALSPEDGYRVETDCGFATLLGVAQTIELHHARLAGWYGEDPFTDRQGTVRIVPEANGLESEGAPFWWAGGFQGGDITTMRFSCGTIEGLGHGLTHELTHRFDGALFPGIPAWLAEGKAVWTGAAYGHSRDDAFIPNHCSFGTIESAFIKGYGGLGKLESLLDGTPEDYRDNYVAGYALYVYLTSWEVNGARLYADRFLEYMQDARKGAKDPVGFFTEMFADGSGGRPADLQAFANAFGEFISGFYWKNPKPWTSRYTQATGAPGGEPYIYDEPTWVWSRRRAEPFFGQDHAREAGELLLELGKGRDAVRALVWALAVDGRTPRVERLLTSALLEMREHDAAWVIARTHLFPYEAAAEPAPFGSAIPRTRDLLAALGAAAQGYSAAGQSRAASALAADHDRLASWVGGEPRLLAAPPAGEFAHGFDESPRPLSLEGWVEDGLTGFEERRVKGLWYAADNGDLHVGRKKPRRGTGRMDRNSHQRDAFVRSNDWILPGAYRIKTRVQFTTSYVSGAVILGYDRRDRNVRIQFSAGDFMYAIGENEDVPEFESMSWRVHGLFDREYALPGSTTGGTIDFEHPSLTFELELVVDGATVHVLIDGERVGMYHTPDGAALEGYIGFATSTGAIRVQAPTVERLDRSRLAGRDLDFPLGLDLRRAGSDSFDALAGLPVRGFTPATNGTLLLWIPMPRLEEGEAFDPNEVLSSATTAAVRLSTISERGGTPQPLVLALPRVLGEEAVKGLREELGSRVRIVTHANSGTPAGAEEAPDRGRRWLFFVDSAGVARVVKRFFGQESGFDGALRHWLDVFRDHGRPSRDLPEVPRGAEDSAEEEDE
jgi:hypothetical protein